MSFFESTGERLTKEDIISSFKKTGVEKPLLTGIEVEKFGIDGKTGETAVYTGKNSFLAILGKMYEELGWQIEEQVDHFILKMKRGRSVLDLESDGRIELATIPRKSLHALAREFRIHRNEISEISDVYGIKWLSIGCHPISREEDIKNIPEERKLQLYKFHKNLKDLFGNKYSIQWSKNNSSIHVNIDYRSEEDFARKSKILHRLSPVFRAMFANSPFVNGKFSGYMSYRSFVTLKGLPQAQISKVLYESDFSYQDWVDFVLSRPILFLKKNESWVYPNMIFAKYLDQGFEGHFADMKDIEMHFKTIWSDLRMRNTIEIRSFDSPPPELVPSVPALVKGLAYNDKALEKCWDIVKSWRYEDYNQLQNDVAKYALKTNIQGRKVLDIAKELIDIAESSLKENRIVDINGRDESHYLKPLKEYVFVKGKSPAEWVLEKWQGEWNESFFPVFEWCRY